MKGKIFAVILLLNFAFSLTLNAQWARTYGGSEDDYPSSILETSDGGYIVAGTTESFGDEIRNIWILKLALDGTIEWQKTYRGGEREYAYSIQQTSEGGYIIGGSVQLIGQGWFILVIKISPLGDIEWKQYYQDPNHDYPHPFTEEPTGSQGAELYSIQQTNDGGYIAVCNAWIHFDDEIAIWILKLSAAGEIEWEKIYGRSAIDDQVYSVKQTNDGGYIVAGHTESYGAGSSDILILKLALDGTIEWQKTYGGVESEKTNSILLTNDGGYIVAGHTESYGAGSSDVLILKLALDGTIEWQKTYGGNASDAANSIQKTFDGGYIVAGTSYSFVVGNWEFWILKLNILGAIEWQKTYGGGQIEEAKSIQQTIDGGYIVAGTTDTYGAGKRDYLILKLFSNGDISPACRFISDSNAEVFDTGITPLDSYLDTENFDIFQKKDITVSLQNSEAVVYSLCSGQHTLSITTSSGGTSEPPAGTYIYDHAVRTSINPNPDEGYIFIGWSGDVTSTDSLISITMDSDKSVKANFSENVIEKLFEDAKKAPCFIATAAFGSPLHPFVRTLQDFRDKYFMSSRAGRKLVSLYYKYSPRIAELITNHKVLRIVIRIWLIPFVALGYSMVHFGPVKTTMMLVLSIMPMFFFVWFYRRRNKHLDN